MCVSCKEVKKNVESRDQSALGWHLVCSSFPQKQILLPFLIVHNCNYKTNKQTK